MKNVISASRRTDIPAFYLKWFMNAIQTGGLSVHNPLYRKNVKSVDLSPDKVEWIIFWSRNYDIFLRNYKFFNPYRLFFHFTVVSYSSILERRHISQNTAMKQAERLTDLYGGDSIVWRYDPIVFWQDGNNLLSNFNESEFREYCRLFSSVGIHRCYFSFVSHYPKFIKRFKIKYPDLSLVQPDQFRIQDTLTFMKESAIKYNIKLYSCCNNSLIDDFILSGSCISGSLLNALSGCTTVSEAKAPTRHDCGCTKSIDIGDYVNHPCYFGCIYCYANPVWR